MKKVIAHGSPFTRPQLVRAGAALVFVCLLVSLAAPIQTVRAAGDFSVTKTADTDDGACTPADCSLREAVRAANTAQGGTIHLPAGTYLLTRAGPDEDLGSTGDLDLTAPTTILGSGQPVIDGSGNDRVLHIHSGASLVQGVVLRNGSSSSSGGGVRVESGAQLRLVDSTVKDNATSRLGGGIYNTGLLVLQRALLSGNSAGMDGGGIYNYFAGVTLENSTLSGNRASDSGGGVFHVASANPAQTLQLVSSTLADNHADSNQDGTGSGGGIYQTTFNSQVKLKNSLLADNWQGALANDCLGRLQSLGYNLIETQTGCVIQTPNHDLLGQDPGLGPLADHGGPTLTHAPVLRTSPLIDAGTPGGCTSADGAALTVDQTGGPRGLGGNGDGTPTCDIGAFELGPLPAAIASSLQSALQSTDQPGTSGAQVLIGEMASYAVGISIGPGGLPSASLEVILAEGLAFAGCTGVSAETNLHTTQSGGFPGICDSPQITAEPPGSPENSAQGRHAAFQLGEIANLGSESGRLTFEVRVVVLNSAGNQAGKALDGQATFNSPGLTLTTPLQPVQVIEPDPGFELSASQPANPVSPVQFTLTVHHPTTAALSEPEISDLLPAAFQYVDGSLECISGVIPAELAYQPEARTVRVSWDSLPADGQTTSLRFQAKIPARSRSQTYTNNARLIWSSLPGSTAAPLTPNNPLSTERFYAPGSSLNDYTLTAAASVMPILLPETGFAPGRVTRLPAQTAEKAYTALSQISLEIPALDVEIPVMGVPRSAAGWDLSWLGEQAGYLEGTTYPSWDGVTVLAGHTTLPSGLPGPFSGLSSLRWGDELILHANGQVYVYEVRQVRLVQPDDLSAFQASTDFLAESHYLPGL